MKNLPTLFFAVFASIALPVQADTFMADTFSYDDGQLTASDFDGAPGEDVSGGNWVAHSGGTFDDNLAVIGGEVQILNSGSEDANREAGVTMAAGETWYYAAQVTVNDTRFDANLEALNEDYFMHFKDSGFGFRGRAFIQEPTVFATNTFTFGIAASSDVHGAANNNKWTSDLTFGTQYTIVTEYDFDSGDVRFWVDPTAITDASITDTDPNANSPGAGISSLGLRQDFLGGTANNEILVDNVAIGDNFADVLAALGTDVGPSTGSDVDLDGDGDVDGADFLAIQRTNPSLISQWEIEYGAGGLAAISVVPEPSSLALIGLALALVPFSRRK